MAGGINAGQILQHNLGVPAPGLQPNFNHMQQFCQTAGNSLQQLGLELGRLTNVPQVQNNQLTQALIGAIQQLTVSIQNMDTRQRAAEENSSARVLNSWVGHHLNLPLTPLVNSTTNIAIPNFPANLGVLEGMNIATMHPILQELGVPVGQLPPHIQPCRRLLKQKIGIAT